VISKLFGRSDVVQGVPVNHHAVDKGFDEGKRRSLSSAGLFALGSNKRSISYNAVA
jgi:hypothetical protein